MGAFGSIIAGAGNAAQDYGKQVRGILESRRHDITQLLGQAFLTEDDPQTRAGLAGLIGDVSANKPIGQIAQKFQTLHQKRVADEQALQSVLPRPEEPPAPVPGITRAGETPGTSLHIPMFGEPSPGPGPAAQPATNPTQLGSPPIPSAPEAPAQPAATPAIQPIQAAAAPAIAPVQAQPQTGPADLNAQMDSEIENLYRGFGGRSGSTPHLRAAMLPVENQIRQKYHVLGQALTTRQWDLGERSKALGEMQQSPYWKSLSAPIQAQWTAWAHSAQAPLPAVAGALNPRMLAQKTLGAQLPPEATEYGTDKPLDKNGYYRVSIIPASGEFIYEPIAAPLVTSISNEGVGTQVPNVPGASRGLISGLATSNNRLQTITGVTGETAWQSAARRAAGLPALPTGGINPAMAVNQRTTDTQALPTGETISQVTSKKTFPGTTAPSGGAAPKSRPQGTPDWENRVKTIANTVMTGTQSEAQQKATLSMLVGPPKSPLAEAVREEMARLQAEDPGPFTFDGPTAQLAQRATQTLTHIDTINKIIARLEAKGELGPIMGRWNEVMTKKLGKDLTANQDYVSLANNMDLLTKNMGWIHGGSRGGGSIQMVQSFGKNINTDKMDADTLRSAINAEKDWIQTYADPKHTTQRSTIPPVQSNIDRLVDKYK